MKNIKIGMFMILHMKKPSLVTLLPLSGFPDPFRQNPDNSPQDHEQKETARYQILCCKVGMQVLGIHSKW